MKRLLNAALIALLVCSLLYVDATVYGEPSYSGTINSNTTWAAANSAYTLTGNLTIDNGVTLTIEPGVVVRMPSDCLLQVNGRLVAEGTSSQKITVQGGGIHFADSSSGSSIKNAILDSTNLVVASSVVIDGNTIVGRGSANSFEAILITGGSPTISGNSIYGADSQRGIRLTGGSPTITNNGLMGMIISEGNNVGALVISHNTIEGGISLSQSGATITNNLITGFKYVNFNGDVDSLYNLIYNSWLGGGIHITADYENIQHGAGATITDNVITGCEGGISVLQGGTTTIQRNLIVNTTREALSVSSDAIINENTIRNSVRGIVVGNAPTLTVKNNNIENSGYKIYLYTGNNIDAASNWWGTTDTQTIENSIWDSTFEQYDGNVTTNPILTAPNQAAYPNSMTFPYINMPGSSGTDNPFHIGTNSTVTDVVYDPENATLSFTVSGPSGTAGSANVTVGKSVMPNGDALKVYMDGKQISYQLGDNGNSWNLGFAYTHSTHHITITGIAIQTQPTPTPIQTPTPTAIDEYQVAAIVTAVLALVSIGIVLVFVKKKKSNL
jgi:hypothetical protein